MQDAKTYVTRKAKEKSILGKNGSVRFTDIHFCERRIALIAITSVIAYFARGVNCTLVDTKANLFLSGATFPILRNFQFKELVDFS